MVFARKYFYEDNFFENINSSEKAYWTGFFYADGYITKTNTFGCALKADDKEQLINFLNIIHCSLQALEFQSTDSCRFTLYNPKMVNDLKKIGFTNEKSYDKTLIVWDNIPSEYKKDFILGLWDGDGSFAISNDKRHRNLASLICNNENLLEEIVKYINSYLGIDFCKVKQRTPGDPYPRIRLQDNKAKIFGDWLYKNVDYPFLQRKHFIFKQFKIGSKANFGMNNVRSKGVICIDSNKAYATLKECCLEEFNVYSPGISNSIGAVCRGERQTTHNKRFRYMTEQEREDFKNGQLNL